MKSRNLIYLFCFFLLIIMILIYKMKENKQNEKTVITAAQILGNPNYLAISYGGYRFKSREDHQPTILELKEDLRLLYAMGIRILRTYNVQPNLPHASNVLEAIHQLKQEDPTFEMYVMLGAWIDCLNAWTDKEPNHAIESQENEGEIARAVALANQYPDIVKVIAVGNEAMVKWATSYYVQPDVILKWVVHLQNLKKNSALSKDVWITSSDNFASWGGGDPVYHVENLEKLVKAVDYLSVHTYPMHDTHYNPKFWGVLAEEQNLSDLEKIEKAMQRSIEYAASQYEGVKRYINSIGVYKPIHIGETGWSTFSNDLYGNQGSKATDELKSGLYYKYMRAWTLEKGMSCFYFEAFDEIWKDAQNSGGSENHFGLFTMEGEAKFPLWDLVDKGVFKGLTRNGKSVTKTYNGNKETLLKEVLVPNTFDKR